MSVVIIQEPIYPDKRGWFGRRFGGRWTPVYAYNHDEVVSCLWTVEKQNRLHAQTWRGKIGKVTLGGYLPKPFRFCDRKCLVTGVEKVA